MFDINVKIGTADEAAKAAAVFAAVADVFCSEDAAPARRGPGRPRKNVAEAPKVEAPAEQPRVEAVAEQPKPDPVALYQALSGSVAETTTTTTTPPAVTAPAEPPAATAEPAAGSSEPATAAAAAEPPAADTRTFDELLTAVRARAHARGVEWLRPVLAKYGVKNLSSLTVEQLRESLV
jgi:hypothetical protein